LMCDSHTDVDKVLLNLEAKEFTMEKSTLQSLQQLIQWVADLALVLLSRLPHGTKPSGVSSALSKNQIFTGLVLEGFTYNTSAGTALRLLLCGQPAVFSVRCKMH